MSRTEAGSQRRVLVCGSRGKSSIVRLLYTAMQAEGLQTWARITGVVPRELGPDGICNISRSAGAHVEEMRWWLGQLPASTQAIVLENSALTAEFQALGGRWLRPDVTVLANTLPDHQELWGPGADDAVRVLAAGIPEQGQVVLPAGLQADQYLMELLSHRRCRLVFAEPANAVAEEYRDINLGLALATLEQLGLATAPALQAMLAMPRDRYDFHIARCGGAQVAMAFSANDISSTRMLFESLEWSPGETRLIYNHRADRPGRLKSFVDWLGQTRWHEVIVIGDRPRARPGFARYLNVKSAQDLVRLFQPGDRIFGCGNIAGLPLSLAAILDQ